MKLFLGRFASIKVDSTFLFNDILRSSPFINDIFSLIKKPAPPECFLFQDVTWERDLINRRIRPN